MQTSSPWLLLLTKYEPESVVKKCTVCARSAPSKSAETLKPHPVPTQPWQKIGTDLFQKNGQNYIVVMDYYSLWPEVYQLHQITSTDVITVMKDIFSWHGTPEELVSDNGTQYKSHLFCKFITAWGIHHITSSPRYPLSNGLAEAAVKMTKAMIRKQVETKQDITGLLIIRNTTLQCGYSPTQLLMGRRLIDNLLCMSPSNSVTPKCNLTKEREVQERHFNNSTAKTSSSKF